MGEEEEEKECVRIYSINQNQTESTLFFVCLIKKKEKTHVKKLNFTLVFFI